MDQHFELVIIGAGPAGMTAAIYGKRAGLKCAIIEGEAPGGKLLKTAEIANYPGVANVNGADLAISMFEQVSSFDCDMFFSRVKKVINGAVKTIVLEDDTSITADAVIVATGTRERLLNIPNEKELTGKGVSYCAVCDAAFYRNKKVAVIGAGNSALEESIYLTELVEKVYIIMRRDVFRADAVVVEKVKNNPKIEIISRYIPYQIIEKDGKVGGIEIEQTESKEHRILEVEGIFPYIGADPCTEFLEGLNILNPYGYMEVNSDMSTNIEGIYGAGDVCDKILRQVVTATNDGAIAAQSALKYIRK